MLGIILMNSTYACLLIVAVIWIFQYHLSLNGGIIIYISALVQYIFCYWLLMTFKENDVKGFLAFNVCCFLEYGIMIIIAVLTEFENKYLAMLILLIYIPTVNVFMVLISSMSKKLSEAQNAYVISFQRLPAIPAAVILGLAFSIGYLWAQFFRFVYRKLKDKNASLYRLLVILSMSVIYVVGNVRHRYYHIMAINSNKNTNVQIAIIAVMTLIMVFLTTNVITFTYNRFELRRLRQENEETRRWISDLQKQYTQVQQSNQGMEKLFLEHLEKRESLEKEGLEKEGLEETDKNIDSADHKTPLDWKKDTGESWNLSLTGNILLDTLFAYYCHKAREKNVVFEIQSELAGGETVKTKNYRISPGTNLLDADGREISLDDEGEHSQKQNLDENIQLMQQIDMVTISDGVLAVYFEEAEEQEGYVFVNLKLGGGKLLLDYELNKELSIDRLSFGICHRYKKLKPVRRIVHFANVNIKM